MNEQAKTWRKLSDISKDLDHWRVDRWRLDVHWEDGDLIDRFVEAKPGLTVQAASLADLTIGGEYRRGRGVGARVLAIPARNRNLSVVGWQSLFEDGWRTRGKGWTAFGWQNFAKPRTVVVAEGVGDYCVALETVHGQGWAPQVAVLGLAGASRAGNLADQIVQASNAAGMRPIVVACCDGDKAGRDANRRIRQRVGEAGFRSAALALDDGEDLRDEVQEHGTYALSKRIGAASYDATVLRTPAPGPAPRLRWDRPDAQALRDAAQAHGTRWKSQGPRNEWHGSCPSIDGVGCGAGSDRFWIDSKGLIGCRRCGDGGNAIAAALFKAAKA